MSSQGRGYGPIADGIVVAFWIITAVMFSGICGVVVSMVSGFLAGLIVG